MMLSKADVAEILGVSERTVIRLTRDGKLPFYRPSPRVIRYDSADVEGYLQSCRRQQVPDDRYVNGRLVWKPGMKVV